MNTPTNNATNNVPQTPLRKVVSIITDIPPTPGEGLTPTEEILTWKSPSTHYVHVEFGWDPK